MTARIDHLVTSGTFSLDGETFDVDNNIWVVGDDEECVVIDAPHSVDDILAVVGGRRVKAIVCTHAHDDHVRVAPALRERVVAPIMLHPDDRPLWELTHVDQLWDLDLADGVEIPVAGTTLTVLALLYTLYFARPFLLPIVVALLLSFLFSPLVRTMARWHVKPPLGAGIVVLGLLAVLAQLGVPAGEGRVLVVDDDPQMRDLLARLLEREGYRPVVAADGPSALAHIEEGVPDAILLDLMMPRMDGFELLATLRRRPGGRQVPVVVVTAKSISEADGISLERYAERLLERDATADDELVTALAAELAALLGEPAVEAR